MEYAKAFLSKHISSLIHKDGIKKQFLATISEFKHTGLDDPLSEKEFTKTEGLIHRYPDRVVLTVTNRCFAYCRFCFRKNNWANFEGFNLQESINYISKHKEIREVLISGGDPFFLTDKRLDEILNAIKSIQHIRFIRIGTRILTANPKRVRNDTIAMLKKYRTIWIAAHINHPDEITDEFRFAARMFIDAGIAIVSQTVLLKNINDNYNTLKNLFCELTAIGIKPYYLFGCDFAKGNEHFRVSIEKALSIMESLRGNISGLCMPNFSFDLPNGGGKIVLEPNRTIEKKGNRYLFKNFEGGEYEYIDV